MSYLLFFILGSIIGTLTGIVIMCILQINRANEIEEKYNILIKNKVKDEKKKC